MILFILVIIIWILLLFRFIYLSWPTIRYWRIHSRMNEIIKLKWDLRGEGIAVFVLLLLALFFLYASYYRHFYLWLSARPRMVTFQILIFFILGILIIWASFLPKIRSDIYQRKASRLSGIGSILLGIASLVLLLLPQLFLHCGTALTLSGFICLGFGNAVKIHGLKILIRSYVKGS